jgi:hypothetical protein
MKFRGMWCGERRAQSGSRACAGAACANHIFYERASSPMQSEAGGLSV